MIWYNKKLTGFFFFQISKVEIIHRKEFEWYTRQVQVLKENVKDMLMASKKDTAEHIEFLYYYSWLSKKLNKKI